MEFKVKEVTKEEKSRVEVENELLKKHEEKFEDSDVKEETQPEKIDLNKSAKLYEAAAFSGYNAAQRNLGILKNMREKNTYDQTEAYAWLLIASINKDSYAPAIFRGLASAMSPEEIDAGRKKATQFLEKSQQILNDWSPAPQAP